ncbi:PEP-CTERM sorting domain-containing protein [Leptolyngbya sp. FACHB-541]|uniref:PEP-CTERM sorting domain-containing protein n=1 Tax=Leptolyngbya sp. FACHB-541 TaxID=2692810 RepID=UPI001684109D|nr:PEP-CTERM sorting domain-containing protein [Leptolyngbya sp. FACHB-541]MBD1997161.1 PEP-CTERM sorting domain-containing protein [Leptolyngbya sp. FACHB-541]
MKRFALAVGLGLGLTAIAAPAHAALFAWDVEYRGWWEESGGGSIFGTIVADEEDTQDGIISGDELKSWLWNWSGNDVVPAFFFSSKESGATADFDASFYVDGRLNQPELLDGLDQGTFTSGSGDAVLDLEFLYAISYTDGVESLSPGNPEAVLGTVAVADPVPVPEPAAVLGLTALAGLAATTLKRQKLEA